MLLAALNLYASRRVRKTVRESSGARVAPAANHTAGWPAETRKRHLCEQHGRSLANQLHIGDATPSRVGAAARPLLDILGRSTPVVSLV